ncbi:hypothetical protein [Nonomuraea sp. JJY05]|uniref:hypothetical protein n=1 Tax=Nonomuraea sp. JJY05 TaxID=3350255 RepID=UPI00373F1007
MRFDGAERAAHRLAEVQFGKGERVPVAPPQFGGAQFAQRGSDDDRHVGNGGGQPRIGERGGDGGAQPAGGAPWFILAGNGPVVDLVRVLHPETGTVEGAQRSDAGASVAQRPVHCFGFVAEAGDNAHADDVPAQRCSCGTRSW